MNHALAVVLLLVSGSVCSVATQPAGHPPIQQSPASQPPQPPPARGEDVASLDAVISAFFAAQSGAPDAPRDWDRLHSLFVPDGRLCAARPSAEGGAGVLIMPVYEYVEYNRKYFEKGGLVEREVARRIEEFGNIAHVWSTYESRRRAEDPEPYSRGIYSIQLLQSAPSSWRIVNVYWDFERPENPLPERYLQSPRP